MPSSPEVDTASFGLTSHEAAMRLRQYGENTLEQAERFRPLFAFIHEFSSPLLLLLIGAATISFFLGQQISAIIIAVMVVLSAILDFVNTYQSQRAAEKLASSVASTASVYRDGKLQEIPLRLLVPGDVLELSAGDIVPADCVLLKADDFFVNQSALTGESFPVEKYAPQEPFHFSKPDYRQEKLVARPVGDAEMSHDPSNLHTALMGTSVVTGFGTAEVVFTGSKAQFGTIAQSIARGEEETNFDRGMKQFSVLILRLTIAMVVTVFLINAGLGRGVLDSFIFAIAIAVGLTPELLPVIMTVALAHGSRRMAREHVIVKNLSAIQNFGSMSILCTDKTGTLTEDSITLVKCVDSSDVDSPDTWRWSYISSIYHTARKSPLDDAIRKHSAMDIRSYTKIDEIPFDFKRRRGSVVVEHEGKRILITKGAPEDVFAVCTSLSPEARTQAAAEYAKLSAEGFRVLALAIKEIPSDYTQTTYSASHEQDMAFCGFAAFFDPPKATAAHALTDLRELGITVKIITGDSDVLTKRVCNELNLPITRIMNGDELRTLSDEMLAPQLKDVSVFARVTPDQKERIVRLLRANGDTVGYLGDGINDAPVLKAADVGISVNNAVDVAKETADIILLDKDLDVLKNGVIEGRRTFQNTLKYIKMGFSSNFGNMFSMTGASLILPFLPMLPTQILLNNFLYDISQMSLPSDTTDAESIRTPLSWDMSQFWRYILVFGAFSSLFDFATFYVLYGVFKLNEPAFQTGWFIESIATQTLIVFIIRTKRVPFFKSLPAWGVATSVCTIVAIAWVIPYTLIGSLISFEPLPIPILLTITGMVILYLALGDAVKAIFYRRFAHAY